MHGTSSAGGTALTGGACGRTAGRNVSGQSAGMGALEQRGGGVPSRVGGATCLKIFLYRRFAFLGSL